MHADDLRANLEPQSAAVNVVLVSKQGTSPDWWYVILLAAGSASLAVAAARRKPRWVLVCGMVRLALAALAEVASIGILLVPAVVAAAVAAAGTSQRGHNGEPAR